MIDAHKKAFIEEATDLLSQLETSLLELENNPNNSEIIAKVFRSLHTIKGSSGMFGYDDIAMFTHDIENVYDKVRNNEIKIDKQLIDLTLEARDQISIMLQTDNKKLIVDEEITKQILVAFRKINTDTENVDLNKSEEKKSKPVEKFIESKEIKTFLINFKPQAEIFQTGTNPVNLVIELAELGQSIVLVSFKELQTIDKMNPENCYASWEVLVRTKRGLDAIKDVFIFVEDECELEISEIDKEKKFDNNQYFSEFRDNLFEIAKNQQITIAEYFNKFSLSSKTSDSNIDNSKKVKNTIENSVKESDTSSSIRVSSEKLDELVNLVGELVTVQARLSQIAATSTDLNIISVSEEVERLTWSLRDSALNTRMLPIGTTFSKFKRLVRDLSKELGKEVQIITEGGETELDKTIIEKLNDPLVHIIRNCIDHGIENPEVREEKGKNKIGTVKLSASQSGGNVLVEISDDGAGMNKDVIRQKAINTGLINEKDELTDNQIYALVFSSGFSTAEKVTNVSGRGVGMDVVKRAIESLRGIIEINSNPNEGTSIILKLPLTLAIIDGLLVKIDDDNFVLPLSTIEECIELTQKDIVQEHEMDLINVRGTIVPFINLRERFGITSDKPKIQQIVVADIKGTKTGFVVDQVMGQHQTVLKSLGQLYKNVEGISGATILGDGTVALILDIQKLTQEHERHEKILYGVKQ